MEWAYLFIPEARQDDKEAECEQNKCQYKSSFKNVHCDSSYVCIVCRRKRLDTKRVVQTHRYLHVFRRRKTRSEKRRNRIRNRYALACVPKGWKALFLSITPWPITRCVSKRTRLNHFISCGRPALTWYWSPKIQYQEPLIPRSTKRGYILPCVLGKFLFRFGLGCVTACCEDLAGKHCIWLVDDCNLILTAISSWRAAHIIVYAILVVGSSTILRTTKRRLNKNTVVDISKDMASAILFKWIVFTSLLTYCSANNSTSNVVDASKYIDVFNTGSELGGVIFFAVNRIAMPLATYLYTMDISMVFKLYRLLLWMHRLLLFCWLVTKSVNSVWSMICEGC